ncbi:MAG: hypothetical protein FWF76_05860 [Oscillospiraceae bacterium]|nr:hypothetical protein [Oscillospiraceae bacterium]
MKLKKILGAVAAVVASGAMALSVVATPIISETGVQGGAWAFQTHVAGDSVAAPLEGIEPHIITGVRVTFSNVSPFVDPEDGEETATATIAFMSELEWDENGGPFSIWENGEATNLVNTIDFDGEAGEYLQISVGLWDEGSSADVTVEILGPNGVVLADGATEESISGGANGGDATTAADSATTTDPAAKAPVAGLGGLAVLGGVAVLATGAIVLSRKRK